MHFSPSQALLGLLPALIPSALGAPASGTNVTIHGMYSTNSTATTTGTTPSLVDRSMPPPEASNLLCYKQKQGCNYKDVYREKAELYASTMCAKQKGYIGKPGWEGTFAWDRNKYWVSYNMRVEWIEGCTAGGDGTMSIVAPGHGITCFDLLFQTWINCNNGGRGGTIEFGCLKYYYNIINGDQAGPGYCVNLPFDNSTLGHGY